MIRTNPFRHTHGRSHIWILVPVCLGVISIAGSVAAKTSDSNRAAPPPATPIPLSDNSLSPEPVQPVAASASTSLNVNGEVIEIAPNEQFERVISTPDTTSVISASSEQTTSAAEQTSQNRVNVDVTTSTTPGSSVTERSQLRIHLHQNTQN